MNRLLQQGDRFKFKTPPVLSGYVKFHDGAPPTPDLSRLSVEDGGPPNVSAGWTETCSHGFTKKHEVRVDVAAPAAWGEATWEVIRTMYGGGGTAHGPGDVYPDGHCVQAKCSLTDAVLQFYQSGCFRGMRTPDQIDLVSL